MSFEVALLTAGVAFLLIGLVGHIKVKEFEMGTDSSYIRIVISVVGVGLLYLSFNPDLLRKENSTQPETVRIAQEEEAARIAQEEEAARKQIGVKA